MNTKTRNILGILAFAALIGALSLLSSCTPAGESIKDRIETFVTAVNKRDTSTFKDCLDSSARDYTTAATVPWIEAKFPATDYSIASFTTTGNTAVVRLSCSTTPLDLTFEMTENKGNMFEGSTYSIRKIKITNGAYFFE
ncbi:hypothetical protein MASR2M78_09050 [Treponema sp.]